MGTSAENTLAGIAAALAAGADAIEVDVRVTADDEVVLIHDDNLERICGDPHPVSRVNLSDLKKLPIPDPVTGNPLEPVPTLREAMQLVAGQATLIIEVKQRQMEWQLATVLEEYSDQAVMLWTFDPIVVGALRMALPPKLEVALLVSDEAIRELGNDGVLQEARSKRADAVLYEAEYIDDDRVTRARMAGLRIYSGATDDPDQIAHVVAAGVHGFCTNDAAAGREVLTAIAEGRDLETIAFAVPEARPTAA